MRLYKNISVLGLLSILLCLSLSACGEVAEGEKDTLQVTESSTEKETYDNSSSTVPAKKFDISLPQDITVELFGLDILRTKRSQWEEHIFTIKNPDENIGYYTSFQVGDYQVIHDWMDADKSIFVSGILGKDSSTGAQVVFDKDDKVSELKINMDMGEYFNTSVLNIGDNAKEYVESVQPGTWDKLLAGELLLTEQGFYMLHYTSSSEVFQIGNEDFSISYFLTDGLVDNIYIKVEGNLFRDTGDEDESSIYDLDGFDYYIFGTDIAAMSLRDWLDLYDFDDRNPTEAEFKEIWMNLLDFSKRYINQDNLVVYCDETLLAGEEVKAYIGYSETDESKNWSMSLYSVTGQEEWPSTIFIDINREGFITIYLDIWEKYPMITSNFIMPGDNIRTLLNSYEDGLFETILSLDADDTYCIGPYEFTGFNDPASSEGMISLRKNDDGYMEWISIYFEDEIVTRVSRTYHGIISDFEEKLSLQ